MLPLLLTLATALSPQAEPAQNMNVPCCGAKVDEERPAALPEAQNTGCCPACEAPAPKAVDGNRKEGRTPKASQPADSPWATGWYLPY